MGVIYIWQYVMHVMIMILLSPQVLPQTTTRLNIDIYLSCEIYQLVMLNLATEFML